MMREPRNRDNGASDVWALTAYGPPRQLQEIEGQEKDLNRFLIDVQEELMDALLYIEAAKRCLTDEIEQAMINRNKIIGQNGNDGLHYDEDHALDLVLNDIVKDIEVDEDETL